MSGCVILASGRGTNARAIAENPALAPADISAIISDRKQSQVLLWAEEARLRAHYVPAAGRARDEVDTALIDVISAFGEPIIVLAGFMRILGSSFVSRFEGRIINIHPSLLPRHRGMHAIERSFESPDDRAGVTVHCVDDGVDTGPALAQASFSKEETGSLDTFEARIHEVEHALYPEVVRQLLSAEACAAASVSPVRLDSLQLDPEALSRGLPVGVRLEIPSADHSVPTTQRKR